jgi:hypothetical protein
MATQQTAIKMHEQPASATQRKSAERGERAGSMRRRYSTRYALHGLAARPSTLFIESGLLPAGMSERLVDGFHLLPDEPGLGDQS